MKRPSVALYAFMPYGAPELIESADACLSRALFAAMGVVLAAFAVLMALGLLRPPGAPPARTIEIALHDLTAPPTIRLPDSAPLVATPVTPSRAAVPVVTPDAQVTTETTIASQAEQSQTGSVTDAPGEGAAVVVQPSGTNDHPDINAPMDVDRMPELLGSVQPDYPDLAREAGVDGVVRLRALVGRDGRVQDVHVDHSIALLDAAAVDAVRRWVFSPAMSNGHPVAVWVAIPVRFTLR